MISRPEEQNNLFNKLNNYMQKYIFVNSYNKNQDLRFSRNTARLF